MGGMHGEAYTNHALQQADLIIGIGTRFDDRLTSTAQHLCAQAKVIHVDIDPAEIGKRVRVDLPDRGRCAATCLRQLVPLVEPADARRMDRADRRVARRDAGSRATLWQQSDELVPQYVIRSSGRPPQGEAIMVSDVGQNQMWEAQYYRHNRCRAA